MKEKPAAEQTKNNSNEGAYSSGESNPIDADSNKEEIPDEIKKMKVAELKDALRALKLGVTGLKATLQVRLRDAMKNNLVPANENEQIAGY